MWKVLSLALILLTVVAGLTVYNNSRKIDNPLSSTTEDQVQSPPMEVIAKNLSVPWALAFLPNGNILATERKGTVKLIDQSGKQIPKEIGNIEVRQTGESGLHGIAIHPNYPDPPYIYLYYTYSSGGDNSLNRVSRFNFDSTFLTDEQVIVDKIPGAIFHDGGRIKFGPDSDLYITTGDAQNPSLAQDKNSLAGKILRVKDGQVAVFSYGHRNPQGMTWDNFGNMWATEHGQSAQDEINQIQIGRNYGWPTIRGDETKEGLESPILHSGSQTWAPAGAVFYQDSIYFGGLRGQALFEYNIATKALKEYFQGQFGRIREVVLGPDHMLYITTSNRDGRGNPAPDDDKIIRIDPQKL